MRSYTLNFNQLFNLTKLFSDYLNRDLQEYYKYDFLDPNAVFEAAELIDKNDYNREKLYRIVLEGNNQFESSQKTLDNIELLKQKDTLCIFSGQQAGFCSAPMYIIYKALTAVKLAQRYERILKRPVIPCFWIATDDHDFEEVRSSSFLQRSGELTRVTYTPKIDPSGMPVADIILDEGVHDFCQAVDKALIDTEFKEPTFEVFKEFYKPGNKLSAAFAKVMNYFLSDWGIVLVDPNFPGMKEFFKPVFAKEALAHNKTYNLYEQRSKRLLENGYHIQVHKTGANLNLFYHDKKRLNLVISGNEYYPDGSSQRFSPRELSEIIENSPHRFSSNVLLRPIAQCTAFPTLCQVVGPSELAYFAQIEPLFEFFDVPFPIIYPRAGMTIIEPHIKKILHKYKIELPDLKNRLEPLIGEVVERLFPSEAASSVMSLNDCLNQDLEGFAEKLKKSDPEGCQHIINYKRHIDFELKKLQKKLKNSNKQRHDYLTDQLRKAQAFIFPEGNLQERVLSPLYFANKYGNDIFKNIYKHLEIDKPVHSVLEL